MQTTSKCAFPEADKIEFHTHSRWGGIQLFKTLELGTVIESKMTSQSNVIVIIKMNSLNVYDRFTGSVLSFCIVLC